MKKQELDLTKFLATDGVREDSPLRGIFHESGYKFASNDRCVVMVKSEYEMEKEGKSISPEGHEFKANFTVYKTTLERSERNLLNVEMKSTLSVKEMRKIAKEAVKGTKKWEKENFFISLEMTDYGYFFMNYINFMLFLHFIEVYPYYKLGISEIEKNLNGLLVESKDNNNKCLILGYNSDNKMGIFEVVATI
jgi:hypothetical protein